ncbi:uncharacterized protein LOC133532638 isoform X2 [Cydia pomonella]|uniref:uncharacterized protein LOC133532638 isoform X2 n=1 Tax=Cydia pomonella TaxID=82600 RepID=UPI002ADD9951|nr:uncharacterized protein LOC133532638 isoform X2 [Cydia pomonella]
MERFTISKSEKQTIYEIYRACRLCGAGGGYRMPIIQNIIDLDSSELELRQKIQECLQLEVRPDDRMPPLICELCVDKVNDFHQFLELTRQTNVKTRTRLGLPIQDIKKGEPEQSNCILGVTEPVYSKEDEPPKKSKAGPKCTKTIKKEPDVVNIKIENASDSSSRSSSVSGRASRSSRRAPSPAPAPAPASAPASAPAPRSRRSLLEEALLRRKPETPKTKEATKKETPKNKTETPKDTQTPKEKKAPPAKKKGELESLLEDSMKFDDSSLLVPRSLKRTREEPPRPALLPKRGNLARYLMDARIRPIPTKELLRELSPPRRPGPKSRQPVREPSPTPRPGPRSRQPVKEPSPTPRPGPKSRQPARELSPTARPGPKSRQTARESSPTPRPGPKSKKARVEEENIPVPLKVPRSKAKLETPKTKEPPKPPEEPALPSVPPYKCIVCDIQCKNSGAFARHLSIHLPTFTKPANACNPCGSWFVTAEEAASHHRFHSASTFPYHCRRCFDDFRTLQLYDEHIESGLCVGDEPPSVQCEECPALLAAAGLRAHRCPGRAPGARLGGKCSKCSRTYATAKTLKKHESQCSQKRKGGDLIADPDVLRRLKPMQVRITSCDGLLAREMGDHYDVSRVKPNYGLAKNYIYPYMKLPPVKSEPLFRDSMVAIPVALKEEFSFTHWDSDSDVEESIIRSVPSLSTLSIKKLFSKNLLGKVPRKRKKVKNETFDNEDEFSVSKDINDIINSLDNKGNGSLDSKDFTARIKDIIGCFDSKMSESVTNEDKTANEQSEIENVDANVNDKTIDNDNLDENDKTTSDDSHCETVDGKVNDETIADDNQNVHDTVTHDDSAKMDLENNENNDSTKENVIDSNDNVNCEESSNDEVNIGEKTIDKVLESNEINDVNNENETINRLDNYDKKIDISLQKSKDDESVAVNTSDLENVPVNGINTPQNENSLVNNFKMNQNESSPEKDSKCNVEIKKNEEVSKQINKESPIKHSIENLIGETDRNSEKLINEVISSIEELNRCHEQLNRHNENEINNSNLMDALDEQIGEKRLSDQDKITLEDLLPKEDKREELENISDDDFNFDT